MDGNFDTKLPFIFLRALMLKSCKYALINSVCRPVSAIVQLQSAKSTFSALLLHFTKVRIFAFPGLKNRLFPRKMHPTRDDY